jgi:hypothetical protein
VALLRGGIRLRHTHAEAHPARLAGARGAFVPFAPCVPFGTLRPRRCRARIHASIGCPGRHVNDLGNCRFSGICALFPGITSDGCGGCGRRRNVSLSHRRRRPCARRPVHPDLRASGRRPVGVDHSFSGPSSAARAAAVPVLTSTATTGGAAPPGRPVSSGVRPGLAIGPRARPCGASRDRLIHDPAGHGPEVILSHPGEPDETRIHRDFIYRSVAGP